MEDGERVEGGEFEDIELLGEAELVGEIGSMTFAADSTKDSRSGCS